MRRGNAARRLLLVVRPSKYVTPLVKAEGNRTRMDLRTERIYKYRTFAFVSQAELPIFPNFVDYVKMLCKLHYVNYANKWHDGALFNKIWCGISIILTTSGSMPPPHHSYPKKPHFCGLRSPFVQSVKRFFCSPRSEERR